MPEVCIWKTLPNMAELLITRMVKVSMAVVVVVAHHTRTRENS